MTANFGPLIPDSLFLRFFIIMYNFVLVLGVQHNDLV